MKALSLFAVLFVARVLMVAGRDFDWSAQLLLVLIWQDALAALLFHAITRLTRNHRLMWGVYTCVVAYVAINIPLVRVMSTPLTLPLQRAASGALSDSIAHYIEWKALAFVVTALASGILVPLGLRAIQSRHRKSMEAGALGVGGLLVIIGFSLVGRVETHGLERNVFYVYISSFQPRHQESDQVADWRSPIYKSSQTSVAPSFYGAASKRNVIMVALESTGASHLKAYGAEQDATPNLTKLSRNSFVFENVYCAYPESIKGLLSVLASRYPALDTEAEAYENLHVSSIAELLRAQGYETALFHSGRFAYLGMQEILKNRGFDIMKDAGEIGGNHESSFGVDEPATVDHMLKWIDSRSSSTPFFLHYLPIAGHHPYLTPGQPTFAGDSDRARHLNALLHGDASLGHFIEGLKARGLYDNSCFIFYGDHGEAFGEHEGNLGHTLFVYEENVRVPWIISIPGVTHGVTRVDVLSSLIDVAPTLCHLLGLEAPPDFQGATALGGPPQMALFHTDYSLALLGLRDGPWKFIYELQAGRTSLYHLEHDPGELANLASHHPALTQQYTERLRQWSAAQRGELSRLAKSPVHISARLPF